MVSRTLTLLLIVGVILMSIELWWKPAPKPKPHRVEIGKSLAMVRMRRLGVEGDWRDYTTARLYGVQIYAG